MKLRLQVALLTGNAFLLGFNMALFTANPGSYDTLKRLLLIFSLGVTLALFVLFTTEKENDDA